MALNHYTSFSLVFLATATILLAGNASAHSTVSNLCAHTDYPALCKSIVKVKDTAGSATAKAIHALILKTNIAKSSAIKIGASKGGSNIDTCMEVYDDAISNLITSMKNLKSKDKASLNINLSAALTDYVTCDDSYTETPGVTCPLGKVNELLRKMASNALEFASELH